MEKHLYPVTYEVVFHNPPLTREEVELRGLGGCDAVILISKIYAEDGSSSQVVVSGNGRTDGQVSAIDQFKAWSLWASELMQREDLPAEYREFCQCVFETLRQSVLAAREKQ